MSEAGSETGNPDKGQLLSGKVGKLVRQVNGYDRFFVGEHAPFYLIKVNRTIKEPV